MKRNFAFLLLLISQISHSQSYTFDKFANYHSTFNSYDLGVFCNSKDLGIYMEIVTSYKHPIAYVFDVKNQKRHEFEILADKLDNGSIQNRFIYKSSVKLSRQKNLLIYEYVQLSEDSIYRYSKLNVFKNNKQKKFVREIELKIKKDSVNYFPLFSFASMHTIETNIDLNFEIGGIIISCKFTDLKKNTSQIILTQFKDIAIKLDVNEEILLP